MSEMIYSFHKNLAKHRFGNDLSGFFFYFKWRWINWVSISVFSSKTICIQEKILFLQDMNMRDAYVL